MPPFFQDVLDLARFRVKTLDHYAYEWWQPVVWLCLLGLLPGLFGSDLNASLFERLPFFLVLTWAQVLVITLFFSWWLKLGKRWSGEGSLFPLVVLATSSQLLEPLFNQLPKEAALPFVLLLACYQVAVLVNALAKACQVRTGHVVLGLFAYLPTGFILALLSMGFASQAGWLPDAPNEPATPVVQQEQP